MSEVNGRPGGLVGIAAAFASAKAQGRAALITYLTLGYPTPAQSLPLVKALAEGGADLIELGVPFSDPVADGPTIQRASHKALEAGTTPKGCLEMVRSLREAGVRVPLLLMGYYNPVYTYGPAAYARDCRAADADGLIVPDLPPEEASELNTACRAEGLALVYLVSPTTPPERAGQIARATSGFLYAISRLGTTGTGLDVTPALRAHLKALRAVAQTPLAVGFGLSRPDQVRALAPLADGLIVGSAIVERAVDGPEALREYVATLRAAL